MSYTRTQWVESETPLSADNMNNIEDGIEELQDQKVDKASGKGLSTNDYTTAEKTKLAGIEAGAEVNPGNATSSEAGLMSAADKSKLNLIAERANQVVMDKFTINNISVTTRSTTTGNYSVSKAGYTLLGIVGFYFEDSTPAVVADTWKFIEVSRLYPDNNKIYYSITLNTPSTITSAVKLNVYCLYMK